MDRSILKNGLIKQELVLLFPFIKEPCKEFVLTEVKILTHKQSHHYVFHALKKFVALGIITEKKKGNTNIYALNPKNKTLHYLTLVEYLLAEERSDIPYKNIHLITNKLKTPFFTLLIGGSYAKGKQKSTSDLDIAFIVPDLRYKKPCQIALKEGELLIPEIHGYVFTAEDFYEMLTNDEFNYGKELARTHIMYYGAEQYYTLLFKAMNHGFKG